MRRRRAIVALDGTPIVYSQSTRPGGDPLRVLVEPGSPARDVPAQVDFTLETLDALLGIAGWRPAAAALDAVAHAALPPSAEAARALRGGAALGLAAGEDGFDLRLYLDLRAGAARERWRRAACAFGTVGSARSEATFVAIAERAAPLGVPVGIAAVLRESELRGLRLYIGLEDTSAASLAALSGAAPAVVGAFCDALGPFAPQAVTAAFDLAVHEGALQPRLARAKLDACTLDRPHEHAVRRLHVLLDALHLPGAGSDGLLADLDRCFGCSRIQYVGLGLRGGNHEVTVYAQPGGAARD